MMTPEQLKKASAIHKKIAFSEEILKSLRKSNTVIEAQKKTSTRIKFTYQPKSKITSEVLINSEWFNSPELKSDFRHCVKTAKDGFIELLEKDLELMKEELIRLNEIG